MYLFTLMNSLEGELGKLSQLDEESKEALAPIVLSMKDKLTRVIKNKQLGRVSNEKIIDVIGEGAGPIQDSE
jgi:dsDNA-binding SOS-regulon protein